MRTFATYIATGATAVAMAITPAAAEKMKDSATTAEDRVEMQDEQTLDQAELRGTKTKDNVITKHQKDVLDSDKKDIDPDKADAKLDDQSNDSADASTESDSERMSQTDSMTGEEPETMSN